MGECGLMDERSSSGKRPIVSMHLSRLMPVTSERRWASRLILASFWVTVAGGWGFEEGE